MILFLLTLGYTASIAFYIWTKEWAIKQCVLFWRTTYIVRNQDIKYHWTDYVAMFLPMMNVVFALVNLIHGVCFKFHLVSMLRRFGLNC